MKQSPGHSGHYSQHVLKSQDICNSAAKRLTSACAPCRRTRNKSWRSETVKVKHFPSLSWWHRAEDTGCYQIFLDIATRYYQILPTSTYDIYGMYLDITGWFDILLILLGALPAGHCKRWPTLYIARYHQCQAARDPQRALAASGPWALPAIPRRHGWSLFVCLISDMNIAETSWTSMFIYLISLNNNLNVFGSLKLIGFTIIWLVHVVFWAHYLLLLSFNIRLESGLKPKE